MRNRKRTLTWLLTGLLASALTGTAQKTAVRPVTDPRAPQDFALRTVDGVGLNYSSAAPSGNWLLVLVHASNRPTDRLLASLDRNQVPQLNGRVVVVGVGMSEQKLKALKAAHPEMVDAAWYLDENSNILEQMHMRVVPAIAGMRDQGAEWRLTGAVLSDERVRGMGADWMQKESEMDEARAPRELKAKPVKE